MSLATRPVGAHRAPATPSQTAAAADQSSVQINLKPQQISTTYTGAAQLNQSLQGGQAQPLSMASGDFDGDGAADLLTGYAGPGGGILSLYRGNSEATNPRKPENIQGLSEGRFPAPFLDKARTFTSPEAPNFLAVGDFNQDGRLDALTAARGSNSLYVLLGNGQGGLSFAQPIQLTGQVTTLLTGDAGAQDGLADVMVGILGPAGPAVLVYEGANSSLWGEPAVYPLQAEATALALGKLNAYGSTDIAVASGNQVVIIHANDRSGDGTLSTLGPLAQMERINFPFVVRSLITGDFIGDRDQRTELALLADDGSVHMMTRGTLDRRPYTEAEKQARYEALESPHRNQQKAHASLNAGVPEQWIQADSLSATTSVSGNVSPQAILTAAKISNQATPDIMVLDPANNRLQVLPLVQNMSKEEADAQVLPNEHRTSVAFDVGGAPVAVLPMRLNVDGKTDLVVLNEGQVAPVGETSAIFATFQVTKTADTFDGTCNADCSLREAINAANHNGVNTSDMITFNLNGTFQLTIATSGEGNFSGNEGVRDLDIIDGDLTIVGSSPANTIVQAGTTPSTNGANGDGISRVFHVNPDPSDQTFDTVFQNMTIRNGKQAASATAGLAGGIFFDGFNTTNNTTDSTLTVSNVAITNNYCSLDGGGIWADNGLVTINSASTISNNITGAGDGGGIFHSSARHVSITGSTISGNIAHDDVTGTTDPGQIAQFGQGGGVKIGGSERSTISSTTVSSNQADLFDGGGVYITTPMTIDSSSIIQSNTAGRDGGGVYSDQDPPSIAAGHDMLTSVTIKGNAATRNGGGIYKGRGNLDINGCTIGGTGAGGPNTAVLGGGIFAQPTRAGTVSPENSTLTFLTTASTIAANTASTSGGGLYISNFINSVTSTSTVNFNVGSTIGGATSADGNSAPIGGGIFINSGTLSMTGGNITNNKATGNGGGINAAGGAITLNNLTMKGNKADSDANSSGDGGAIFSNGGAFGVGATTAVTIGGTAAGEPNTARNGGGIAISGGTFTMTGGSINGNSATAEGGGVRSSVGLTFNSAVSVTNNTASGNGGGFSFTGGTTAINGASSITGNTATASGGGIHNAGGTITLPNSATIGGAGALRNMAANGGGIFNNGGSLTMTGGSLTGNQATTDGGGANIIAGTLTFSSGVSITNNTANGNGGGVAGAGGALNVNGGGSITGNTADNDANNTGNGGGIFNNGSTTLIPNSTTIGGAGALKNMARNGGGIASQSGSLTMTGGTLTGNQSTADGGGLFTAGGSVTLNGVTPINNNTAGGNGGGVAHTGGTSNVNNATITGNTATANGGAFFNNGAGLTASLNRIVSNNAASGTGIFNQSGAPDVQNNWWGCDGFPNTGGCQTSTGPAAASTDADPRVDLVLTATPSTINPGGTSTLKADVSKNSNGAAINPVVMNGLTVTFASDSLGSVAPTTAVLAALMATTTYTAGPNAGLSNVTAQVDNPPAATAQVTIQANADLQVTKMADVSQVLRGNNITYTINFKNNGPTNDPNVTVTDAVPTNTTFVSAMVTTGSGWTETDPGVGNTGNIVFSKGDVANQETAVFTVVVKVNANAPIGAIISNSATAAGFPVDPNNGNNTGTATTTVIALADLAVTKSDSPDPVSAGANITYTINFVNNGPDPASTVTVTDATPANTTFVSAMVTTGSGWTETDPGVGNTGNVVFSKGSVASGETAVFTVVVKVNSNVADGSTITNSATAASTTMDPNNSNNTGTATTTTNTRADLAVTKSDSPDPVVAGNNLTYTINFVNNGPSDASTVTVTDAVPANTTFVSAAVTTGSGWTKMEPSVGGTGNIVFSKGTVVAGETAVFTVVVKVSASAADGSTITNNATAATTTTDSNSANNTGTATTTVNRRTDLAVVKTDMPDPVIAGNNITYTINFTSNGPSDADTVTVTDATPANTTFVSAMVTTGTGWTETDPGVGNTGNVVFSKGTVVSGETAVFTVVVKVNASAAHGSMITNTATAASASTDPTSANNSSISTTLVERQADLAVTKSDSPDPVNAGANITYTINFVNNGPSNASTVTVTDAVPANTTFVSAMVTTGTGWTETDPGVGNTGNVVFSKSEVAAAETAVFTVVVKVNDNAPDGGTITNSATAASATTDPTSGNNTGTATTTVVNQADLAVTKSDSPDPVVAGNNITYTINFVNNGSGGALNVTVTDATPANTTFVSAMVTTGTGWAVMNPAPGGTGNVVFSKSPVANGETAVFQVVVKVNANTASGATITNSATAASTTTDPTSGNNTGTATTTVGTQADIAVTKSDSPDPVVAGTDITYTVTITNNGPSDAQGVSLTDAVPANTTFVSEMQNTGPMFTCTNPSAGGTGNVSCTITTLAAGASATFQIVVHVNANVAAGTTITNSAVGATTTTDPNSGNNTGTATTTVSTSADLSVTKSDAPDPVVAGNNITYTINFANNGPSDAQSVTVTDATPANTTFVSAMVTTGTGWTETDPGVGNTGNVVFSKGTVAAGETAVFTVVVKVNANAGSTISNSATAASTTSDPNSGNNTGTTTTTVNTSADLAVTKSDSPDPVVAGGNITYTINFVNNGPSDASTVTVTDATPANTTFVSASVTTGSGWAVMNPAPGGTGNVVFSKGTVAAGETAVFQIVVNVNAGTANNTTITNSATAASTTTDPDNSNNTGTATTTVINQADLAVTKSDSPDPVVAGNNITYTINFVNNGPGGALNVAVTDATPANTTFVSASVTTGSGWTVMNPAPGGTGNVVFSKSPVANGETAVFQVVVNVNANTASGATITNSATASTTTIDPDNSNNTGTATTTVGTQADIAVTKSDSPDPVVAGTDITYTVTITNNGPSDAQGVSLTDAVPANTTFVSEMQNTGPMFTCTNPSAGGTGNVSCTITTLAAGASATFQIVVHVNANVAAGTTITNSAVGATTTTDPNSGNNTGTATTTVNTSADLSVTKSDSPDPVVAGTNITYTINFTNNGSSDAQSVTVTDAVPANTTFVSAAVTTGTGWTKTEPSVGGTGNIVFSKGTVAAGETAVFTVVVKVNANVADGSTITNSATAASTTSDPSSGNNTGTTTTTVNTQANIAVTKSDTPDPVTAGGDLTYTITVTNNGPSDAQGLQLSDTLPANTTFVSFTVPMGWTRTDSVMVGGTGTVTATATTLAAGASSQFTLVVHVDPNTPHLTVLTNSATATTTTTDPDSGNNTGTTTTTVNARPDLSVTKTDVNDPVMLGTQISYHIVVTNNGPSNATGVVVTDKMPSSSMFVSATPSVGSCTAPVNNNITCTIGDMSNGATATVDIIVKSTGNPSTIFDTAKVTGNEADPNTANNEASESTRVVGFRSFKFSPTSATGGCDSSVGTLTFTSGAPAGLTINFTDGGSPAVDPIMSVTTTGGEISIPVTATTQLVMAEVVVNITASAGPNSIVGRLKVTPVRITSLTFDPNPVTGGQATTGTVTLTCPAPKDIVVRLSFDKAVAKPDVTMFTIPHGQTMGTFTITTKHPVVQTVATITASANGGYVRSTVTVNP